MKHFHSIYLVGIFWGDGWIECLASCACVITSVNKLSHSIHSDAGNPRIALLAVSQHLLGARQKCLALRRWILEFWEAFCLLCLPTPVESKLIPHYVGSAAHARGWSWKVFYGNEELWIKIVEWRLLSTIQRRNGWKSTQKPPHCDTTLFNLPSIFVSWIAFN